MKKNDGIVSLVVNAVATRIASARVAMAGGFNGLDQKRPRAWREYGWKEEMPGFNDFYLAYSRTGICNGLVNKIVRKCWQTHPWIIQGDEKDKNDPYTQWENDLLDGLDVKAIWRAFKEADRMRLVGVWSAMILHVKDSLDWDKPVSGNSKIIKITNAWPGSLMPTKWDEDRQSERYGEPVMWQYTEQVGNQKKEVLIHHSRVFILGDTASNAIGFLAPMYNNFTNLEKVEGGVPESVLKNASRNVVVNFDREVDLGAIAQAHGVEVSELQDVYDEVTRGINSGIDSTLVTKGAQTSTLTTTVPDPTPAFTANLQSISAASDVPMKILVGNQNGERASTEDNKQFSETCQSRRNNELEEDIHGFFRFLMEHGLIKPVPRFSVIWDDLTVSTRAERLDNGKKMTEMNSSSPGEPIWSTREIREECGSDGEIVYGDDEPEDDEDDKDLSRG